MAKKRTRQHKAELKQRREMQTSYDRSQSRDQGYTYSYQATQVSPSQPPNLIKSDQDYIVQDLKKTILISALLLAVVIGIYFYLRYN